MKVTALRSAQDCTSTTNLYSISRAKKVSLLVVAALTVSMLAVLVGCGGNADTLSGGGDSSGTASLANPIEVVESVDIINEQLSTNMVVPADGTIEYCQIIDNSVGSVSFSLDNQVYLYRAKAAEESEDISGLYFDFTSLEESTLGDYDCVIEYNDDGPGYCRWFDEAAGITYSVSVDTGASKDKLSNIALQLITEQG